jgi:hypothetical protein
MKVIPFFIILVTMKKDKCMFRPFQDAREFARSLELKKQQEWLDYCHSGNKPIDIPTHPESSYKKDFLGFVDFLGYKSDKKPMKRGYKKKNWTFCDIVNISKKYDNKTEFIKKENKCYVAASRRGLIELITNKMSRNKGILQRILYKAEFSNKTVYIGLTHNLNIRKSQHLNLKRLTSVGKYIIEFNEEPVFSILGEGDSLLMGEKERELINEYRTKGFNVINQRPGGELGLTISKITKENCFNICKQYDNIRDLIDYHNGIYQKMLKNKWLDECTSHMDVRYRKGQWTFESCKELASKCKTITEFKKHSPSAYIIVLKNGWIDEIKQHMVSGKIKFPFEICLETAKKYKTKNDLRKCEPNIMRIIYHNKWSEKISEICWG